MKKKLLLCVTLLAACIALVGLLTVSSSAATSGHYTYTVSNGEATITDVSTSISGAVTIPSTLGGYPVTSIGDYAFSGCSNLTSIVIPDSVTSIGDQAFYDCSSLTNVTIPDSVTSIGEYAFDDCTGLKSIVIPASVKSIKNQAFSGCENIRDVYISDMDVWCDISFGDHSSNPLCHGADLYLNGELVSELVIPDTVTSVRSFVFYGCTSLTKIVISDNVTRIGMWAFYKCTGLASIVIPDSVTSIDYRAFSDYDSLIYNEYDNAYYLGNELNPYLLLVKAKGTSITSCEIHPDTRFILSWAFEDCEALMSVVIPGGMAEIGVHAFEDCDALADVYYAGTEEEWEKIEKNFPYDRTLDRVTIHYSYAP